QDGRVFLYPFDLLELDSQDLRREPLEARKAMLASVLTKAGPGVRLNEHCDDLSADVVIPARQPARLRGHREQAARFALSVGALAGLAEDEEPERTRSEARSGGAWGKERWP